MAQRDRLEILGTTGAILFADDRLRLVRGADMEVEVTLIDLAATDASYSPCTHFLDRLDDGGLRDFTGTISKRCVLSSRYTTLLFFSPTLGARGLAEPKLRSRSGVSPGHQHRARELRLIGGIREVLGLEAQRVPAGVRTARLARDAAVQRVGRVQLQTRLRGRDGESSPGRWLEHARSPLQAATRPREHEVVVVSATDRDLWMVVCDVSADPHGRPEIKRRPGDRREFAGRDLRGVHRRVAIGVDLDDMVEHVTDAITGEVEVGVLRQIDGVALSVVATYSTTI